AALSNAARIARKRSSTASGVFGVREDVKFVIANSSQDLPCHLRRVHASADPFGKPSIVRVRRLHWCRRAITLGAIALRDNRAQRVLRHVLLEDHQVVEHAHHMSKLEKGASHPGLKIIAKLATVLEVQPASLLIMPPKAND